MSHTNFMLSVSFLKTCPGFFPSLLAFIKRYGLRIINTSISAEMPAFHDTLMRFDKVSVTRAARQRGILYRR